MPQGKSSTAINLLQIKDGEGSEAPQISTSLKRESLWLSSNLIFLTSTLRAGDFFKDHRLGLLRVDFQNRDVHRWIGASKRLLGIADRDIPTVTYVSNMICWHRSNILKLRRHLEDTNGMHWIRAICQHLSISEYILYGVFVEHLLGLDSANHFIFDTELIKPSWNYSLNDPAKINHFLGHFAESHIGVMIHSKDGVPIHLYRDQIKSLWG